MKTNKISLLNVTKKGEAPKESDGIKVAQHSGMVDTQCFWMSNKCTCQNEKEYYALTKTVNVMLKQRTPLKWDSAGFFIEEVWLLLLLGV